MLFVQVMGYLWEREGKGRVVCKTSQVFNRGCLPCQPTELKSTVLFGLGSGSHNSGLKSGCLSLEL